MASSGAVWLFGFHILPPTPQGAVGGQAGADHADHCRTGTGGGIIHNEGNRFHQADRLTPGAVHHFGHHRGLRRGAAVNRFPAGSEARKRPGRVWAGPPG